MGYSQAWAWHEPWYESLWRLHFLYSLISFSSFPFSPSPDDRILVRFENAFRSLRVNHVPKFRGLVNNCWRWDEDPKNCHPPMCDFQHWVGRLKPWMQGPPQPPSLPKPGPLPPLSQQQHEQTTATTVNGTAGIIGTRGGSSSSSSSSYSSSSSSFSSSSNSAEHITEDNMADSPEHLWFYVLKQINKKYGMGLENELKHWPYSNNNDNTNNNNNNNTWQPPVGFSLLEDQQRGVKTIFT